MRAALLTLALTACGSSAADQPDAAIDGPAYLTGMPCLGWIDIPTVYQRVEPDRICTVDLTGIDYSTSSIFGGPLRADFAGARRLDGSYGQEHATLIAGDRYMVNRVMWTNRAGKAVFLKDTTRCQWVNCE